ncbi:hypothetical protein [Flavobacterium cerinum]|uniref:Uncharacterized protein n=1 Tax=Flavobacterium cerinum TaxID=2502784 RepID=A0ABY5IRK1_9FLAO|nr:hypothetical protein [Flavobacterium cerinum]UUC44177.1 hypothetical protein NOX80_11085 [Flavobacterium cerinum]
MNLGENYSKTVAKKFDKLPVYVPDTKIKPGAVISFGKDMLGRPNKPFGTFHHITDLVGGKVYDFQITNPPKPSSTAVLNFVSQNEVTVTSALKANVPNAVDGDIAFQFGKAGSVLLYAVKGTDYGIDQLALKKNLSKVANEEKWEDYYIVTEVTIYERALVYQSIDRNGALAVSASAKNISISGNDITNIGAEATFSVKWKDKQAFSVDWAENVVLFMKLVRFSKGELKVYEKALTGANAVSSGEFELVEVDTNLMLLQE